MVRVAQSGLRGAFDEFADDHGGAAGDGGAGVGDEGGVGLGDEDFVVGEAEGFGAQTWQRMVLVPWPNSVEETRIRGRPSGVMLDLDEGVEAALAGAGEA